MCGKQLQLGAGHRCSGGIEDRSFEAGIRRPELPILADEHPCGNQNEEPIPAEHV
jgi:hypothetical protein